VSRLREISERLGAISRELEDPAVDDGRAAELASEAAELAGEAVEETNRSLRESDG